MRSVIGLTFIIGVSLSLSLLLGSLQKHGTGDAASVMVQPRRLDEAGNRVFGAVLWASNVGCFFTVVCALCIADNIIGQREKLAVVPPIDTDSCGTNDGVPQDDAELLTAESPR